MLSGDVLVILMVAFGLFAIIMFILFFVYLKKYRIEKNREDDYKKDIDRNVELDDEKNEIDNDKEFVPKKKK